MRFGVKKLILACIKRFHHYVAYFLDQDMFYKDYAATQLLQTSTDRTCPVHAIPNIKKFECPFVYVDTFGVRLALAGEPKNK